MQQPDKENARAGEQRAADNKNLENYSATNYHALQGHIRRHGKSIIGDCPRCGYKGALSITEKDGQRLYYCHAGCAQADLWAVVRDANTVSYQAVRHIEARPIDKGLDDYIRQLWQSSLPAKGSAVEIYLNARSITGDIPTSLRFLSRHRHSDTGTYWPLILAAVTDYTGKLKALHRTFLTNGGEKAPVEPAKKTLAPVIGYATHLSNAGERLAIVEGIETGLSVQQATGIATWAALSAGGIARLILPPLPLAREVLICADNDANGVGQRAAEKAATRWYAEGRSVRIATPLQAGKDFNDLLRKVSL